MKGNYRILWILRHVIGRNRFTHKGTGLLLLVLFLGGTLAGSVQAAPAAAPVRATSVTFSLEAWARSTVCVDETFPVFVWAQRHIGGSSAGGASSTDRIGGFPVTATARPSSIVVLASGSPAMIGGADLRTEFQFTAQKVGTVEILVDGLVPAAYYPAGTGSGIPAETLYATGSASVEVVECPITISTVDHNQVNAGEGYRMAWYGIVAPVKLPQVDNEGKRFAASTTSTVLIMQQAPGCSISISVGTRSVYITAEKTGSKYAITIEEGELEVEDSTSCWGDTTVYMINAGPTEPVKFSVNTKGGTFRRTMGEAGYRVSVKAIVTKPRNR